MNPSQNKSELRRTEHSFVWKRHDIYIATSLTSYSDILYRLNVMVVPKTLVQYVSFNHGSDHMKSCQKNPIK
jgi:hypothetical protein